MKQKGLRKLVSMILAVVMVVAMSATAFADDTYSITITSAANGETYSAYKVFDATYTTVETEDEDGNTNTVTLTSYTIESDSIFYSAVTSSGLFNLTQAVGSTTTYVVTLKDSTTTSGEDILNALSNVDLSDVTADGTAVAGNGSATIELDEAGYYYVTTTLGSVVALDSANPTATIAEKNETPTVTKTVEEDSTSTYGGTNTADIGQTVNFSSTISNAWDLTALTYHDVMDDGLDFDRTTVVVKVGETTLTEGETGDYTVVINGLEDDCTFEIVFTEAGLGKVTEDSTITITYSATVNTDAVIGSTGNDNTASISYGNASSSEEVKTTTYVYSFDLMKTDGTSELKGATFNLYLGEKLLYFTYDEATDTYTLSESTVDGAAADISVGSATIKGLDADTYTLTETEAPDGYNKLTSSVTVKIAEDGSITQDGDNATQVTVINIAGSSLPTTGGMGTTIFYIVGGVLVLGAAVLFVTKKRLGSEN